MTDVEIEAAYESYLAARGKNLDACIAGLPALRGPAGRAHFAGPDRRPAAEPNQYAVILTDPQKHPHVKQAAARKVTDWFVSADGQIQSPTASSTSSHSSFRMPRPSNR